MSIDRLDHVSIRTADLDATRLFYTDVLGFEVGPRPEFPFPGVWLYNNGSAVVHVIGIDRDDPSGLLDYLGERGAEGLKGSGTVDHVAFTGRDLPALRTRFQAAGIPFRERVVPNMKLGQLFVEDPNGVVIELNFPGEA